MDLVETVSEVGQDIGDNAGTGIFMLDTRGDEADIVEMGGGSDEHGGLA